MRTASTGFEAAQRAPRLMARAGIIAIGGPPFAGRAVIASLITEHLFGALKLETIERLTHEEYRPEGPRRPAAERALPALLAAAHDHLGGALPPTLVLCARFDTPASRKKAQACARAAGATFLHVEARASNIRAIRRLYRAFGGAEPEARLERFLALHERYRPVDVAEARALPSLRLEKVLQDPGAAAERVLSRWSELGA